MGDLLLRDVRPWPREPGDGTVDVVIRDGRIASGPPPAGVPVADGRGGVLLPAFADVHAHLDSTRLGLPFRPHTAEPGLVGLIEQRSPRTGARREVRSRSGRPARSGRRSPPVPRRFAATPRSTPTAASSGWRVCWRPARRMRSGPTCRWSPSRSRGSCAIRAPPTCSMPPCGPAPTSSVASIRAPSTVTRSDTSTSCSASPSGTASASTSTCTRPGELGAFTIELIAERTAALGMQGLVTISHAFALGTVDASRQAALIELLATADIALTTVAPGNREPLPLEALRAGGVRVGLGQDGIRDYWSPYGNGDVLERAWQLAFRNGFRRRRPRRAVRRRGVTGRTSDRRRDGLVTGGDHRTTRSPGWHRALPPISSWSPPTPSPPPSWTTRPGLWSSAAAT